MLPAIRLAPPGRSPKAAPLATNRATPEAGTRRASKRAASAVGPGRAAAAPP